MKSPVILMSVLLATVVASHSAGADDCDPIRAAIEALPAAGGVVNVAAGNYDCGAPLVINRSHVTLKGAGQDKVTIRLLDQVHAPLLIIGDSRTVKNEAGQFVAGSRVSDIRVSGLTFDGNRKNHDPKKECGEHSCNDDPSAVRNNGITIRGASDVTVENVTSHSMISGGMVTEKYCRNLIVHDFNSYDNFFDGFAGYETEQSEFYNLFLHDNLGAGISIDINFNENVLRDSKLFDNRDDGIFARYFSGNLFQRLSIQRSGNHGGFLAKADDARSCPRDNTFDSVVINGSKHAGLRLNDDCPGNRVIGASDLCGNADGGISDQFPGTLESSESVKCR